MARALMMEHFLRLACPDPAGILTANGEASGESRDRRLTII